MKNTYKLMKKYLRLRGTLDALRYGKIDSIDRFGKKYTRQNRADFDAEILAPLSDQIFNLLKENLNKFDAIYFLTKQTIKRRTK
tara:strand:+ start:351 stop:602 length:252 start_codon:yes stop_codon:yes gene_type:complete